VLKRLVSGSGLQSGKSRVSRVGQALQRKAMQVPSCNISLAYDTVGRTLDLEFVGVTVA
jgi:hypothetical protein